MAKIDQKCAENEEIVANLGNFSLQMSNYWRPCPSQYLSFQVQVSFQV